MSRILASCSVVRLQDTRPSIISVTVSAFIVKKLNGAVFGRNTQVSLICYACHYIPQHIIYTTTCNYVDLITTLPNQPMSKRRNPQCGYVYGRFMIKRRYHIFTDLSSVWEVLPSHTPVVMRAEPRVGSSCCN